MEYYKGLNWTAHCFNNTSISLLRSYNYASSISSIVALFLTLGLLLIIFFYNSYYSTLQRLLIYFTLTIASFLAASATDLQLQFELEHYCKWTGFLKMSTHMIAVLFSSEICAYLLCKMCYQVKHNKRLPHLSKVKTILLELGLVCMTVFLPPLLLLPTRDRLGVSSAVCWIQLFESNSCTPVLNDTNPVVLSLMVIKGIFYSFNFLGYFVLIALFCWLACKSETARKQYFSTARRTLILVLLMIFTSGTDLIALFIIVFVLNQATVVPNKVGVFLWSAYYAAIQIVQPIAYLFYLNSVKKFQWDATRSTARRWSRRGTDCCSKALRWLANPLSFSESDALIQTQNNVNLNETPALTSSMSLYGSQRHQNT